MAQYAGQALSTYVTEGHSVSLGPLLDWPAVSIRYDEKPLGCDVLLGSNGDLVAAYSTLDRNTELLPLEQTVITLPAEGCELKHGK